MCMLLPPYRCRAWIRPSTVPWGPHSLAVLRASAPLSTMTLPGKSLLDPHSCVSAVSPGWRAAASLSRAVRAVLSLVRISSGPWPPLGLENSRWVNLACRWRRALAGVRLLSAAIMPKGVDWEVPSAARAMRFIALWYSPSTPTPPFQVSSAVYGMVT